MFAAEIFAASRGYDLATMGDSVSRCLDGIAAIA
jgi:hypothetical protein